MNISVKNIILFLTPFVITLALFILGALFGFELVAVVIILLLIVGFCYVVAELLLDRFGD